MSQAGLSSDLFTYSKLKNRLLKLGYINDAISFFDIMVEMGFDHDANICDTVLKNLVEKYIVLDKKLTYTVMEYMCSSISENMDLAKLLLRVANDR